MNRSIVLVFLTLSAGFTTFVEAPAATITTSSALLADVQSAVNAAGVGDTISVPAGTATWSSPIIVSKNMSIVGAGIGNTTITGNGAIFSYRPTATNGLFRISGFTFNLNGGGGIYLNNGTLFPPVFAVRIDHNRFYNSSQSRAAIENAGCRGVIDHNTFENLQYPLGLGLGCMGWGGWGDFDWFHFPELVWGTPNDNIYCEDNVFTGVTLCVSDANQGGRYVFRYNDITGSTDQFFDTHGGIAGSQRSVMGAEIYGNIIRGGGNITKIQGGGRVTVHHNYQTVPSGSIQMYVNVGCPATAAERMNHTYHFLNRQGGLTGSLMGWGSVGDNCGGVVAQNSTFWIDATSFNGTVGVGSGPLATRPVTCSTGVGYWATDQSTTSLSGMVGNNPATPVSGTLYYGTAPNTWTAFYTPLVYPHPLVTGSVQPTNAVIKVTPSSWDFASVAVGSTGDFVFTVQNTGGGTLAGIATVSAPFYVVTNGTYSLGQNKSQSVTVRFSPTVTGTTNGSVIFTGGGGATATLKGLGASAINEAPAPTNLKVAQFVSWRQRNRLPI